MRSAETRYEAATDWVCTAGEHNGDCCGRLFDNLRRNGAAGHDHVDPMVHQFGCKGRQPIVMTLRPTVQDRHILTFNVAGFLKSFKNCRGNMCELVG